MLDFYINVSYNIDTVKERWSSYRKGFENVKNQRLLKK